MTTHSSFLALGSQRVRDNLETKKQQQQIRYYWNKSVRKKKLKKNILILLPSSIYLWLIFIIYLIFLLSFNYTLLLLFYTTLRGQRLEDMQLKNHLFSFPSSSTLLSPNMALSAVLWGLGVIYVWFSLTLRGSSPFSFGNLWALASALACIL